jgi:Flp pilus assembly protein TadD
VFGQAPRPPRALMPPVPGVQTVASRASSNLSSLESVSPALRQALSALAMAPTSARYLDVATAYTRAGVPDLAYDHLVEGLRHDRTSVALHDALARAWRDWGFPERAMSSANTAVFFGPRSPEARNTLGTILWALGQREGARQAFEAAAALDGGATYAIRNLCMVALTAGRTAESVALCQRAKARQRSSKEPPR